MNGHPILKTKKEQNRIKLIFQHVASLVMMEQKGYILLGITGMSGLH
jgi:hypothetical protein